MSLTAATFAGLFAFSRASTGTFHGSNGFVQTAAIDAPRFGYDPITLAARGILIEPQRTNLFLQSGVLSNASWTKTGATATAAAGTSPENANTATKLAEDTSTGNHQASQAVALTAAQVYSVTFYAKAAERSRVAINATGTAFTGGTGGSGDNKSVVFDLAAGTVAVTDAGVVGYIEPVLPAGWYRCQATYTASSVAGSATFNIRNALVDNSVSYAGTTGSGVLLWGAQAENTGGTASSYIPTTTTTVTRSADLCEIAGSNFTSFFNAAEGTLLVEAVPTAAGFRANQYLAAIANNAGTTGTRLLLLGGTGANTVRSIVDNGVDVTAPAQIAGASFSVAVSYRVGLTLIAIDGYAFLSASGKTPTLTGATELAIGNTTNNSTTVQAGYHIKKVIFIPRALSSLELEALTR